jgi:SHS2 domain-containing protein
MYQRFGHGADIGIKGIGKTLEEAFAEGARAMFDAMVDVKKVKPQKEVKIKAEAANQEELFVEFLNKLLAEADLGNLVFSKFKVVIRNNEILASAWGEELDQEKHNIKTEVKAATYSMLKIGRENNNYFTQCIIDV